MAGLVRERRLYCVFELYMSLDWLVEKASVVDIWRDFWRRCAGTWAFLTLLPGLPNRSCRSVPIGRSLVRCGDILVMGLMFRC